MQFVDRGVEFGSPQKGFYKPFSRDSFMFLGAGIDANSWNALSGLLSILRPDCQQAKRNECVDSQPGRVHAIGNDVSPPSDTRHGWLPLRRLAGNLARRLDETPALIHRDGGPDQAVKRAVKRVRRAVTFGIAAARVLTLRCHYLNPRFGLPGCFLRGAKTGPRRADLCSTSGQFRDCVPPCWATSSPRIPGCGSGIYWPYGMELLARRA